MTEINSEFTPELLASKVASILRFDERTIPYFEKLFQNIQPTPKTALAYNLQLMKKLHGWATA